MARTLQNILSTVRHTQVSHVVLWCECAVLAVVFTMYMYFIASSVVQVILRQEIIVKINKQETMVNELEAQYFAHLDELRPEIAGEYGLVAIEPSAYVTVEASDRLGRRK